MDKHERVADEIVGYISGGDIGTGSISELAFAVLQLAAILRREYGAERNAALDEAARVCLVRIKRDPGYRGQWEGYGGFDDWMTGLECAAAIRALKEAEHG